MPDDLTEAMRSETWTYVGERWTGQKWLPCWIRRNGDGRMEHRYEPPAGRSILAKGLGK